MTLLLYLDIYGSSTREEPLATPSLGRQRFSSSGNAALCTLVGVELTPMLRKGQREGGVKQGHTPAEQFYVLAA